MSLYILDEELWFPDVEEALEDGLLAIGGDLSIERLFLAYSKGIFPWFNDDEIPMWWCPDPRFVLFPDELKVSKSMQQLLKRNTFDFRINTSFSEVIYQCRQTKRKDQDGTWITNDIVEAYTQLHHLGYAHCAETWLGGKLVGGLYGIRMGNIFFGESMFSLESNASKFAFLNYVQQLQTEGVVLIDCQVYTPHLESLGARMIAREDFMGIISTNIPIRSN
ncbi:MAG TPA: leucyl/phenylalanyl-tRNA--protein transferase [Flavipsychrobacter sp.]|nr:leucyl/phenylalanyl-tRNA--protein transferase [Flavipsychrobacter sp.]